MALNRFTQIAKARILRQDQALLHGFQFGRLFPDQVAAGARSYADDPVAICMYLMGVRQGQRHRYVLQTA